MKNKLKNKSLVTVFLKSDQYIKLQSENISEIEYEFHFRGHLLNTTIEEVITNILSNKKKNLQEYLMALRGVYNFVFQDKTNSYVLAVNSHFGELPLYYHYSKNRLVISDSVKCVGNHLESFEINTKSVYEILSFGYILGQKTILRDVSKLKHGCSLSFDEDIQIKPYFKIPYSSQSNTTFRESIDLIDQQFRSSVDLIHQYLEEQKFLCALSGGLDSRMSAISMDKLGGNFLTFTFSQSEYLDHTIANDISETIGRKNYFISLDGGDFLKNIDKVISITEGQTLYSGQTHTHHAINQIDYKKYSFLVSGQLGDVIIGSYKNTAAQEIPHFDKFTSDKMLERVDNSILNDYESHEAFIFENRGINGILTGSNHLYHYIKNDSPFLNPDLVNLLMSLPASYRVNHKLYFEWIKTKYPLACKFKWEKTKAKPGEAFFTFKNKQIYYKQIFWTVKDAITKRLQSSSGQKYNKSINVRMHMNPFGYWYNSNTSLQKWVKNYFKANIERVDNLALRIDLESLFEVNSIIEKLQVLSILGTYKYFQD